MIARLHVHVLLTACLFACPALSPASARESLDLSGGWEAATTRSSVERAPAAGWKAAAVPALFWSGAEGGSSYAWYRRRFSIPASWKARRIILRLAGARFDAHVWIDGRLVGSRLEGYTPWEIELAGVSAATEHRIEIRCQDWGAAFADGFVIPADFRGDLRYATGGRTLAPIGGHFSAYGLWDSVRLESRPRAFLDDVAIYPSVRRGELAVTGAVAAPRAPRTVEAEVLDAGKVLLRLTATPVGADGRWRTAAAFPGAPRWSPEEPRMLSLRLVLRGEAGREADVLEIPFGFRELWAEGPDFVLNGTKRHLLATSTWPSTQAETREQVREVIKQVKAANCVAFRLHTQPWREMWLEEADAAGLMIVDEAALWCDDGRGYAYKDPRFWANYRNHVAGMIRRDRNHASLVMWSLENELLHCGGAKTDPGLEGKLAAIGRFAKELDPGHLITFEADLDPGAADAARRDASASLGGGAADAAQGAADVIGLHYPHELPDYADWPDTAGWLEGETTTGTAGGLMGSRGAKFRWDRGKPLYIGEYLWVPDGSPAAGAIYFGDAAYLDTGLYNLRAKARSWEDQAVAYRAAGVSGQCPWTMFEAGISRFPQDLNPAENILYQAQAGSYVPIAAYPRECDTRFYRGDAVTRTFDVFNDSVDPLVVKLAWALEPGGPNGTSTVFLEPGGRGVIPVLLAADCAGSATLASFGAVVSVGRYKVHETRQSWTLQEKRPLAAPRGLRLMLYDPSRGWAARLKAAGLATKPLRSLDEVSGLDPARDVAVIAPLSLAEPPSATGEAEPQIGRTVPGREAAAAFLGRGGRMLVMEQSSLGGLFPGLSLVDHGATMAFPAGPSALLRGIPDDGLEFWHPGHYVSRAAIRRPDRGGARCPVVTGNRDALDLSTVADVPFGLGRVILVQMLAGEKLDSEPSARRLIQNALDALGAPPPAASPVAVVGDAAFGARIAALGAVTGESAEGPAGARLVAAGGSIDGPGREAVRKWLAAEGGDRIFYWHEPDAAGFAELRPALGLADLEVARMQSPLVVPARSSALLDGLSREDLYFLGPLKGEAWARERDADPAVISEAFVPAMPAASGTAIGAGRMELPPQGAARTKDGSISMYMNGAVTATVTIGAAGLYPVSLVAGGSPARGVWPLVVIRANGAEACRVSLTADGYSAYSALATLPAGEVRLEIAFVNDTVIDGEDRNLLIRSFSVAAAPWTPEGFDILTLPPALVERRTGRVRVVLDTVRWTAASGINRERAGRYASGLLANLGAAFRPPRPDPDWIPPRAFRQSGRFEHFSVDGTRVGFGSNGAAEASFTCATAGRYEVCARASGTSLGGVYARFRISVDGSPAGEVEAASENPDLYETGRAVSLAAGRHTVSIEFTNDEYKPPEDRNLSVQGIGFRRTSDQTAAPDLGR